MIEFITETFYRLIHELKITSHRYLYQTFNTNNRLTGIVGPRGVGKTTLMLQYIKEHLFENNEAFYFSADSVYFNQTTLIEFITELHRKEGYKYFFIDEIHKYQNWNQELKNLYDSYPNLKFVFSGSSMMDLVVGSYDLSRRAKLYHLNGMSFREYLNLITDNNYPTISYSDLITNYQKLTVVLSNIPKISSHFETYKKMGYYPFFMEDEHSFYEKLLRIVEKTIYEDIANFYNLKTQNLHYFKQLLSFLATTPPGELNTNNIAASMKIDNKTVENYLSILEQTGFIRFLFPDGEGHTLLRKPKKILLHNTNLLHALNSYTGKEHSKGFERETFFLQSTRDAGVDLFYSSQTDFMSGEHHFEIGGKNKTKKQISNLDSSFLVKDDILIPRAREIPLFYFGFLY